MPRKKVPCPTCEGSKAAKSEQCRKCKPTYARTAEHKVKMSKRLLGIPKAWLRGRKRPEHSQNLKEVWRDPVRRLEAQVRGREFAADPAWRQKILSSALRGPDAPNWKGGRKASKYAPGFSDWLKKRIRERDAFVCQLCGVPEAELGRKLTIHHSDYDKENHDESNLFAVCVACNSRVNSNRVFWRSKFAAIRFWRERGGYVPERVTIIQKMGQVVIVPFRDAQALEDALVFSDVSLSLKELEKVLKTFPSAEVSS